MTGTDTLVFVVDMIKVYPATDSASGTQVSDGGGSLPTVTAAAGQGPHGQDSRRPRRRAAWWSRP